MVIADSGNKYDKGKVEKILALVVDLNKDELSILIDRLLQELRKRPDGHIETIQT